MRLLQTEITPFINNSLYLDFRDQPFLSSLNNEQASFHKHPELQLTFILEGFGKRIIGNEVAPFEPGDMVFIGSNVPHIWLSDPVFYEEGSNLRSKVITVYINPKIFQQMFDFVSEFDAIREMIKQASKGINIFGETRNVIAEKLIALSSKTGFERVLELLQIMNIISISAEKNLIINKDVEEPVSHSDRLLEVINFIKFNLHEQITLEQVAEVACMTVPSFCRFFKNKTKKTFLQYLVDQRMAHACKLLIEMDKPISEVASLCGYNSNSHFCKVFRERIGQSPYQYKCSIAKCADQC
ncbi:AraC family transcriptional regulator [Chitinophaga pollutisoli]|uniref:AraC family transcriptional regulator n=1 Tax=Chitinophaga pollutisoli TaxID=3133966 RepID=A0ABZ2YRU2_9BACT